MDRFHRFVFEHRRALAAIFAGLAVAAALTALRDRPDGSAILVAGRDLPSGHVVVASDVRTVTVPRTAAPAHAVTSAQSVVGRRVAGPMRRGEPLTDYRVLAPGALAGYGRDTVLTTVRVADGLPGIRVGDRVDIIAVDPGGETPAEVVARAVDVALLPPAVDGTDVVTVSIVTTEDVALTLARVGLTSRFSAVSSAPSP